MQLDPFHLQQRIPPADPNISNPRLDRGPPAGHLHLTAHNLSHYAVHMEHSLQFHSDDRIFSLLPNTIRTERTLPYRSVLGDAADYVDNVANFDNNVAV